METAVPAKQVTRVAGLFLTLLTLAGCVATHTGLLEHFDKAPQAPVAQVMAMWADGVVVQPDPTRNGLPTPGFAGRVYLFPEGLGEPVVAQGPLTIHLYDDSSTLTNPPTAKEIWTIDPANLERVFKKDGLGWGYNLWLPWSTYRQDATKVTLVVGYQPEKGLAAWSSPSVLAVGSDKSGPKGAAKLKAKSKQTTRPDEVTTVFDARVDR